jgi:hypothetical protein
LKKYESDSYYNRSRNSKAKVKLPICRGCTGGSRDEMYCQGCQKTYSLDKFSKAQRSKSDNAVSFFQQYQFAQANSVQKCLTCSQEAEDRVADIKDAIEEQKILDDLEDPSVRSAPALCLLLIAYRLLLL